ncbi:MAG: MBL fold metallo-hydrolase [archaeon]
MNICVLASGSSGNCTLVEGKESSILIDAGISSRQIVKSLSSIGKDLTDIDGVLVTHEHLDHTKGLLKLKDKVPFYMNEFTSDAINMKANLFKRQEIEIKEFQITPIPISHDAADPTGFRIESANKTLGYFTDLGTSDDIIKKTISESNCLVLETNHDIDMLLGGNYPYHLKTRILGDKGHLSNIDAGLLVRDNANPILKNVFLSHLSQNNNTQLLALSTFRKLTNQNRNLKLNSIMTSQTEKTDLIRI